MNGSQIASKSRCGVIALAAVLGITFALPVSAQWKWRDKNGQTQYSDLPPPPGVAEQDILQRPSAAANARRGSAPAPAASAASGAPLLAPKATDPELEARRKRADQEVADKKKEEEAKAAAARADNCAQARAQMRALDSGVRITRTNEKGEREFLDDAARAAEAKRARDAIASECK